MSIRAPVRHPGKSMAAKMIGQAVARERMHKAAAIVEDCVILLSGKMTEWEDKPHFAGQWMLTEIRVGRKVAPVRVSGGGVIQINRSQHHPETREVITDTYQAMTALMYYLRAWKGAKA